MSEFSPVSKVSRKLDTWTNKQRKGACYLMKEYICPNCQETWDVKMAHGVHGLVPGAHVYRKGAWLPLGAVHNCPACCDNEQEHWRWVDDRRNLLERYPRLMAHMICESLGYFTPRSTMRALESYKANQPYYCEWYCHMASFGTRTLEKIGHDVISGAFKSRKNHRGYMADYNQARKCIMAELNGNGPMFASWF